MPDNSGDAPSGLAKDRIAAMEAGFAGLTELLKALRIDLQRPSESGKRGAARGEENLRLLEAGVAAYDVSNKHRRDFLAFIRLNASNDADARTKTVAHVVRRSLLKPGFADYDSEAVAQHSDELVRREAENSVTAAAKAAVQQRFGAGPNPNEEEDDDDEPPSRARQRRPSGRRTRPDFRPTADDADKGKCKGKGKGKAWRCGPPFRFVTTPLHVSAPSRAAELAGVAANRSECARAPDGYYALGLREDVHDYFTINARDTMWRFAALPMGWSLSPYYLCTLMAVMVRYLRQPDFATYSCCGRPFRRHLRRRKARGVCLLPFIDDFMFLAPSRQLALRLRAEVERVWGRMGQAKHPTKAHPEPTQQLQHLGLDLDWVTMQFRTPTATLRRLSNLARDLLCIAARRRRHAPAKLLASLTGQSHFLYLAMPPARFYLREAHTVLGRCSSPSGKVVLLTRQLIRDLEWWRDVPTRHNGAPILRPVETAYLHTDSS
eukprot:jgi/Tetstr1/462557/TSEL_007545.t1